MILFGWGPRRPKDLGGALLMACPYCRQDQLFRHMSQTRAFSLFFIPIIPYGTKHFLLCPVCRNGSELTAAAVPKAVEMVGYTKAYQQQAITAEEYTARAHEFHAFLRAIEAEQDAQAALPHDHLPPPPP